MEPPVNAQARAAVGEWFDLHVDTIYRYVARRLGDELAADVTAETFRTALEHFERFDPARGEPRSWLYGIANNHVHHHWRSERRRLRLLARAATPTLVGDPLLDVDRRIDAEAESHRVIEAVGKLARDDRDLLVLAAWEGLSSHQIADVLGVPASTVRARLRRIRAGLSDNAMGQQGATS